LSKKRKNDKDEVKGKKKEAKKKNKEYEKSVRLSKKRKNDKDEVKGKKKEAKKVDDKKASKENLPDQTTISRRRLTIKTPSSAKHEYNALSPANTVFGIDSLRSNISSFLVSQPTCQTISVVTTMMKDDDFFVSGDSDENKSKGERLQSKLVEIIDKCSLEEYFGPVANSLFNLYDNMAGTEPYMEIKNFSVFKKPIRGVFHPRFELMVYEEQIYFVERGKNLFEWRYNRSHQISDTVKRKLKKFLLSSKFVIGHIVESEDVENDSENDFFDTIHPLNIQFYVAQPEATSSVARNWAK
jgi:hypothetical protein